MYNEIELFKEFIDKSIDTFNWYDFFEKLFKLKEVLDE